MAVFCAYMVLEFKCANFRSVKDEVSLNLSATADKWFEENLVAFDGRKYLKAVEIYGANGSGKSTLLKALVLMAEMVGNCDKEIKPNKLLLSVAASITNIEPVAQAYLFFTQDLVFSGSVLPVTGRMSSSWL